MAWEFTGDKPIFQQITEHIVTDIVSGRYKPGDKLETVRDLALSAGVNPNTMQRALSEIENTGLLCTKRGDGRYVSEDSELMQAVIARQTEKLVDSFLAPIMAMGLNEERILAAVKAGIARKNTNESEVEQP